MEKLCFQAALSSSTNSPMKCIWQMNFLYKFIIQNDKI